MAAPPWRRIRPRMLSRTPEPVVADLAHLEPRAVVAHERLDARRTDLDVDRHRGRTVAYRVEQRLARRLDQRLAAVVHRPVAGHDDLDRDAVLVLDLVGDAR